MTDLEKACLTVVRIEGPIRGREVARHLKEDWKPINEAVAEVRCLRGRVRALNKLINDEKPKGEKRRCR